MTELKYKEGEIVLVKAVVSEVCDGSIDPYRLHKQHQYKERAYFTGRFKDADIYSLLEQAPKQTDGLQLTLGDLELLCRASDALKLPEEKQDAFWVLYNKITEYIDASQNAVLEKKITVGV